MKKSSPIKKIPLTPFRKLIIDGLDVGMKKHYIKGFIEFDVTETRHSIRTYRRQSKCSLSFTAFFIACVAQALQEHKSLNSGIKKNNIIIFDDIDVSLAIEMSLNGEMCTGSAIY
ncbi:2-oxo acid dehydrogenase subunit E2 [candidate division KSB1 bacterium]|nr:2-oxo acid dehydrogenase subunit E2 [candidate division KSB1 bacterium]